MSFIKNSSFLFITMLWFIIPFKGRAQDYRDVIKSATSSPYIGQGNPKVTVHPITKEQCLEKLAKESISYKNSEYKKICNSEYMAPLYDPSKETMAEAKVCIDQFEYPNIPCEYPIVWVRANEAAKICEAVGKRLCDAHEWEGACSGQLLAADYNFKLVGRNEKETIKLRRLEHNKKTKRDWAYGPKSEKGICAADSFKSAGCNGGNWKACGSNTYPAGYFSKCKSKLDVYDQHGNAAEHMNLPLNPEQFSSHPSARLGHTEMKGSWFIFDKYHAHSDWCRWRAPYWHGSRTRYKKSHHNYHLGFRCCKDTEQKQ